ncbi:MAG: GAF domain-containing protein [Myxococcaceae bacterium]|nr:GAF domain-containing protein [Myxococcaceae bacterium]
MIEVLSKISEATKLLMETGFTPTHVTASLAQIGTALGVDRAYIFENQSFPIKGRVVADLKYGWGALSVQSPQQLPALQQISLRELAPLWADALAQGQTISSLASAAPPRMRLLLAEQKTLSLVLAPIKVSKETWGFLGFEDCKRARSWSAEELTLLKALAGGLGTALRHRQMRSSLSQTRTQLAEMMALATPR